MSLSDPLALAGLAAAAFVLFRLVRGLARLRRRNVIRERTTRGRRGEEDAARALARRFAHVERHPRRTCELRIDGVAHRYELCPDFVVGSRRRPIVIEVKSGKDRDPRDPSTRRQLLEYALAFGASKIGLYDAREGSLQWVELEGLPRSRRGWIWLAFALGALAGFLLRDRVP
ncbi:MAG: hypothetical protein JNM84_16065 [Planctomycetes bacterium]|nr:hypothetical protein [Planctomycetota bacterium]